MISFEKLITAFHEAILSANDVLKQKNANILEEFFEYGDGSPNVKELLSKIRLSDNDKEKYQLFEDLQKSIECMEQAKSNPTTKLSPKMVTIQYPSQTENGHRIHDVLVPLISLVPVQQTGIEEVNITTELEFGLKNNELMVSFPQRRRHKSLSKKNRNCTKVEVKLTPTTETEGLKKIIEGYDKVLRAQIPG